MKKKKTKDRLEEELLADPKTSAIIRDARDSRRQEKLEKSQADHFIEVSKMIKLLSRVFSEKMEGLDSTQLSYCNQMKERLGEAMKVLESIDSKNDDQVVNKLSKLEQLLEEVVGKETVVNVAAPIVEVPEPKVIDQTKIIQETKHTEAANQILMKILQYTMKQQGEGVRIKNKEPGDAIPVVLTDKTKKVFYDAVASLVSSGGLLQFFDPNGDPARASVDANGNQATRDFSGLVSEEHDFLDLDYTGVDLTTVTFRSGGSGGTIVATLALTYTANVLQTVTKT